MITTKLTPLALALAFTAGGALAQPAVPPEVTQAIDAINQAGGQVTATVSQVAEQPQVAQAIDVIKEAGEQVTDTVGQVAEDVIAATESSVDMVDDRLLYVGLGAIAGVVAFNLATGGMAAVPMLASIGGEAGAMGTARHGAVAISRVYAVTSAVVGGLVGDYVYRNAQAGRMPSVPSDVAARVTP